MAGEKVLVTGASGFIAKHCIAELLRQGYAVQATLRDLNREEETRRAIGNAGATASEVKFFPADLLQDEGWDKASRAARTCCTSPRRFRSRTPRRRTR